MRTVPIVDHELRRMSPDATCVVNIETGDAANRPELHLSGPAAVDLQRLAVQRAAGGQYAGHGLRLELHARTWSSISSIGGTAFTGNVQSVDLVHDHASVRRRFRTARSRPRSATTTAIRFRPIRRRIRTASGTSPSRPTCGSRTRRRAVPPPSTASSPSIPRTAPAAVTRPRAAAANDQRARWRHRALFRSGRSGRRGWTVRARGSYTPLEMRNLRSFSPSLPAPPRRAGSSARLQRRHPGRPCRDDPAGLRLSDPDRHGGPVDGHRQRLPFDGESGESRAPRSA